MAVIKLSKAWINTSTIISITDRGAGLLAVHHTNDRMVNLNEQDSETLSTWLAENTWHPAIVPAGIVLQMSEDIVDQGKAELPAVLEDFPKGVPGAYATTKRRKSK